MPASSPILAVCISTFALATTPPAFPQAIGWQGPASTPSDSGQGAPLARATGKYGRISLGFEPNRGQADPSVQFLSHGQGYTPFLRQDEALLALRRGMLGNQKTAMSSGSRAPWAASTPEAETSLVRMRFVGTNPHAGVRAEDEQITRTNYFLGNDPGKWRTDIPNYGRVRYAGIYPGIDLVYYGNQHQLEHDFVVEAGADPYKIALSLEGEKDLTLTLQPETWFSGRRAEASVCLSRSPIRRSTAAVLKFRPAIDSSPATSLASRSAATTTLDRCSSILSSSIPHTSAAAGTRMTRATRATGSRWTRTAMLTSSEQPFQPTFQSLPVSSRPRVSDKQLQHRLHHRAESHRNSACLLHVSSTMTAWISNHN